MIGPIGNFGGLLGNAASQKAGITREQFMKLLAAEISNQDPLEPMDNTQFLQQLVSMEQLKSASAVTDGMSGFMNFFQLSIASGTIGQVVKGISDDGEALQGVVLKVKVEGGKILLSTTGGTLPFSNVTEIEAPAYGGF